MYVINITNNTSQTIELEDLKGFTLLVSGTANLLEYFYPTEIANSSSVILNIASQTITVNDGSNDLSPANAIKYVSLHKHVNPVTSDGKEVIRADTRPIGTQTYFTMAGDDITNEKLGDGKAMVWDFSNDDDLYDSNDFENPVVLASGLKAKAINMVFMEPTYLKDGTLYFFDAPWGAYASMYIVIPAGGYYPSKSGTIPASALGLTGSTMYAYATKKVFYACYVNRQHMYGSCPMGDELNAEGAQTEATPAGWYMTGLIVCPENDTAMKGYGSFEMYRVTIELV